MRTNDPLLAAIIAERNARRTTITQRIFGMPARPEPTVIKDMSRATDLDFDPRLDTQEPPSDPIRDAIDQLR